MPVEKYHSIEEMNAAPVRENARDAFERFVRHRTRFRLISHRSYPRGVFRFRSIEEAQAAQKFGAQSPMPLGPDDDK